MDEAVVEGLVREFAASWKNGIEFINQDVLSFFSNRNGMEILKQVILFLMVTLTICSLSFGVIFPFEVSENKSMLTLGLFTHWFAVYTKSLGGIALTLM